MSLIKVDQYYLAHPEVLLKQDINEIIKWNSLDKYIRLLRRSLKEKIIQNDFLLKKESYIPLEVPVNYPFDTQRLEIDDIEVTNRDFIAITVTFDQQKHPQLIITPAYDQKKYIKKVFSSLIYEQHITAVYGCFEAHKSGFIHAHLIVPHYGDYNDLHNKLTGYFTNRTNTKQHAVLIKPVNDLKKWINYINKESTDFIEWNIRKKSLDL